MLHGIPINEQAYDPNLEDMHTTILNGATSGQQKRECMMDYLMTL
jgi:hypothetical protein